jgi:hypothetical protein
MADEDIIELRAQRDGWRAVALHVLQSKDFGDVPPVEFLPETVTPVFDKRDRTPELVEELTRRTYITDVQRWMQPGLASGDTTPTIHIEATFGARARIVIQHRVSHSEAFRFSMANYDLESPYLFTPREVSFELLLRYLDFVIAGYKLAEADRTATTQTEE